MIPLSVHYLKTFGALTGVSPNKTQGVVEVMSVNGTHHLTCRVHLKDGEITGLTKLPCRWVQLRR